MHSTANPFLATIAGILSQISIGKDKTCVDRLRVKCPKETRPQ